MEHVVMVRTHYVAFNPVGGSGLHKCDGALDFGSNIISTRLQFGNGIKRIAAMMRINAIRIQ